MQCKWMSQRRVTEEIMDSPSIDPAAHLQALAGLERINRASHTAEQILKPIIDMARQAQMRRISLLDVACGGGDVPVSVAAAVEQWGIGVDLILVDRSPTALKQAGERAARAGIACQAIQADVLEPFTCPPADVVSSSLFLHHLARPEQVIALLRNIGQCARRMVVINDLRRSRCGWVAAWAGCRILSRSRMVHHDGPASVRAAWTMKELSDMAERAGMTGVGVQACWPWRMLLVWRRPKEGI